MEQQPELVGPEAMSGEAIGEAATFQILDPVLALVAVGVPAVDRLRIARARGDDETGVQPLANRSALTMTRRECGQESAW